MPIWSLTAERLEKLKDAIRRKKAEYDELEAKSDKDLWCADLTVFEAEWEKYLALSAEIQTNIRRMGRRVSKKIGAGGGRGRKPKADDEYEPEKKGRKKAAPAVKAETKTAQRFAEMFTAKPKIKEESQPDAVIELSDNFSDDDFAALSRSKPAAAKASQARSISQSQSEEPEVVPVRNKRAAASKARTLFDADSDSDDDDKMLGDVGALVKGIDKPSGESSGRLSLHTMSRPDSSHGTTSSGTVSKPKGKSAKAFDFDSPDDTNYELLAKPSPFKAAKNGDESQASEDEDDDLALPSKATKAKPAVKASAVSSLTATKKRGKPAAAKAKAESKPESKAASKAVSKPKVALKAAATATTLSPAAKRYAAKKKALKEDSDVDEDEDEDEEDESIAPRPAARGRPGRAAASKRKIIIEDDDSSMMVDEQEEESDDPFVVDDDED